MNIKKVSELTGLSAHTLRYYEKIGLLIDVKRNHSKHRYYTETDLKWIEFIIRLKETAMPLSEMRRFARLRYKGDSTLEERRQMLEVHNRRIKDKIELLQKNQQKLDLKIEHYVQLESEQKKS